MTERRFVMLATKSAIYGLVDVGLAEPVRGTYELTPAALSAFAKGAAANQGGTLLRAWHDHGAGGAFAEIEVSL